MAPYLHLRLADEHDVAMIFEWRNSPFILQRGSSQRVVSWEEHQAWFTKSVSSRETRLIFIILADNTPIGQVRFDREGKDDMQAVISAYVLAEYTGKGYGVRSIMLGCEAVVPYWSNVRSLLACVRMSNEQGQSGFTKAGFKRVPDALCEEEHFSYLFEISSI